MEVAACDALREVCCATRHGTSATRHRGGEVLRWSGRTLPDSSRPTFHSTNNLIIIRLDLALFGQEITSTHDALERAA